ncbi:brachyurin-like [Chironomus tepperi]|uniref:brachyurin-like n=1 Tax=Chironomus tepperi TaxID=113505 RepID=UPI00391F0581
MFKFVLLVFFIIYYSDGCRVIEQRANGVTTDRDDTSFLVLLEGFITFDEKVLCSGVFISQKYILTTGHCVNGTMFVNVHVYAHRLRDVFEDKRSIYRIEKENLIIRNAQDPQHEDVFNDIALIKMPDTFVWKDYLKIANLPTTDFVVGTEGKTYGWGLLSYTDDHAAGLKQEYSLRFISNADCHEAYPNLFWDNGAYGRVCIKALSGTNCVSDNGSPFMVNGIVYGFQSYGQLEACDGDHPNLVQDVFYHLSWIKENAEIQ